MTIVVSMGVLVMILVTILKVSRDHAYIEKSRELQTCGRVTVKEMTVKPFLNKNIN
ncbi:hypothetical protein QR676_08805 [Vibrio sp. TMPB1044]|uniref:hypothetical protein n=1 Tax=Vibrio sp. TMPB1044 TaxID=3051822 RepID=UPI00255B7BA0|nr:hypothetical protein [Vibrio sp. TMPB1044]MDL5027324.1 hypothetical protein [Vibrio sp. TMPB1044]MDN5207452.1 hypothetical protein [Vibrio sp. TMPB1044]